MRWMTVWFVMVLALATFSPASSGNQFEEGLQAAMNDDYTAAFEKWKPLGMQGDGEALFALALMYHAGLHVKQNEAVAIQLYQMAAERGSQMAKAYLAAGYENGWFGLTQNDALAAYWSGRVKAGGENLAVY